MTVKKLKKLEDMIKPILKEQPQTREDDFLLYAEIIKAYNPSVRELEQENAILRMLIYK